MVDLTDDGWRAWVAEVAAALEVSPDEVDVAFIHALTQVVAHEFQRPMAPVSAYMLGLAVALHPEVPVDELRDRIVAVVRAPEEPVVQP